MKILPDYEHMEYRDVYTCRTYPTPALRPLLLLHERSQVHFPALAFSPLLQLWSVVHCDGPC